MDLYIWLEFNTSLSVFLSWRLFQTNQTSRREESEETVSSVSHNMPKCSLIRFFMLSFGIAWLYLTLSSSHVWKPWYGVPGLSMINYFLICWKQHFKIPPVVWGTDSPLFNAWWELTTSQNTACNWGTWKKLYFSPFYIFFNLRSFLQQQGCLSAFVSLYLFSL